MPRAQNPLSRIQIAVAVVAVLVLVITGFAWRSVDSLRSNLATIGGLGLGGAKDGAVDILLVGTDSRTDAHGNPLSQAELDSLRAGEEVASNTDTIILVRVPNDGSSATAISIPRDAYVDVPGLGKSKINAAYGATKEAERQKLIEDGESEKTAENESSQAGREALIKSVANLTGVTVDHYAEIGLLGFVLLTDAVGGVDVCLNAAVDEPLSGAKFPAGEQTLSGPNALSFVRQRHNLPRGDLDRIVRQQVFMASLVREVLSAKTLTSPGKLNQLSAAVKRSVVLDSDWDIIEFATQLQDLAGGKVRFETIPVVDINGMTDYGESIVQVDPKAVRKYVASLAGEEPAEDDTTTSTTPTTMPDIDVSSVTVDVANDSSISGLASTVAATLEDEGFGLGDVGNNTGKSVSRSTVFANKSDSQAGQAVSVTLGGLPIEADSSLASGEVRVVLAGDYKRPAGSSTGSGGVVDAGTSPTPVEPGPAIDAGNKGPHCVN
ncbi:LytR family transcriptional regulator [Rhodococcus hoagii]|uniref:LytR family transcriptional regulator n=1 Tax=Rhodococcus hoagii (strain 103S) TaxID=685727 RepID=A0A3S5Y9Y9_RHOH1|nr:LCP family protein [Prescottella equi]MDP8013671.1 LCP family protein [Prescottella equi]NKR87540.1 LytR family transcriptional regulator [Prescottella equi]NKS08584.1 LytR family transcriptional regulator [Prescottella equi]NKS92087.1 LytR family transcriptional regulator [Prescottella equi]NKT09782.1 LytR family transcriptional regulator [Prescottella equi]